MSQTRPATLLQPAARLVLDGAPHIASNLRQPYPAEQVLDTIARSLGEAREDGT